MLHVGLRRRVQGAVDLDVLGADLIGVVDQVLPPEHVGPVAERPDRRPAGVVRGQERQAAYWVGVVV